MKNEYGIPVAALTGRDVKELEAYLAELKTKAEAAESAYEADYNSETRLVYQSERGWKVEGERVVKRNYGRLNG